VRVRLIAIAVLGAIVLSGAYFGRVLILQGSGGGWSHEAGDAWDAERALTANFESGRPNLTFVVEAREGDVDSPPIVAAARGFIDNLSSRPGITDIESYWDLGRPDWLRSEDGTAALITARLLGSSADYARRAAGVQGVVRSADDAIQVTIGGIAVLHADIQQSLQSTVLPLVAAALLSLGLLFLFLRNWVAVGLLAATAALAVALTLLGTWGIGEFREMPVLSVILGMAASWGLATAGGLVVMSRFIAERSAGVGRRNAVVATISTAGRTVAIASVVLAAAGMGLWILPTALLRSTGYALGLAGLTAGISTVVGLGVLLAIVGVEVVSRERDERDDFVARPLDRVSKAVRRRPVLATVGLVVVLGPLLFLGAGISTGEPAAIGMAPGSSSRRVAQFVAGEFVADDAAAPFVVARNVVDVSGVKNLTAAYARTLSEIDGVVRVDSSEGSFVDGTAVEVPPPVTRRFRGEDTTWFMVPVDGNPNGPTAAAATAAIDEVPPPYRVNVGGAAAREAATVRAIDGRVPYFVLAVILVMIALIGWLLRSINAALRATVTIVLMTSGAALVMKLGFIDGTLGRLLGFTGAGNIAAVGPPIAWSLAVGISAVSLVFGWGAVREAFDATQDSQRSPVIALGSTRRTHLQATALLLLPVVPLLFSAWRTGKLIGAAAIATGLVAVFVGRFVALPAVTAFAPARLWPIDLEGRARRVYAITPAARRCVESARDIVFEPRRKVAAEPGEQIAAESGDGVVAPPVAPVDASPQTTAAAIPVADPHPTVIAAEAAALEDEVEPSAGVAPAATPSAEPQPPPVAEPVADTVSVAPPAPDVAADADVEAPPAAAEATPTEVAAAEPPPMAEPPRKAAQAATPPEPADMQEPEQPAEAAEPVELVGALDTAEPAAEDETATASGQLVVASQEDEALGTDGDDRESGDESGSVDVASLTASVIAALESKVPFTTEISKAFVTNPANNLSRVMEAILRDASARGGEEVLVYGHASRDRYRWMVVDTGPRADNDPDRARTLAEAQRFIRRVGGVVDCRPEGDFTVFVVEIPMAS